MKICEAEKFIYQQKRNDRHLAWKIFRYFRAHQELLKQAEHLKIYEQVKAASLFYTCETGNHDAAEKTESALVMLADIQNACEEFTYVPTREELDHYLHYEKFKDKLCAVAMIYGKNNIFVDTTT